jgi:hypothetical protein
MASAQEALAHYAKRLKMPPDEQILVLAGFLARKFPSMDAEKFTDTMASLLQCGGLPTEVGVDFLCHLVDTYQAQTELVDFLGAYAQAMEPAPAPVAPPPAAPVAVEPPGLVDFPPPEKVTTIEVKVPATEYEQVKKMLDYGREKKQGIINEPLGRAIFRFRDKIDVPSGPYIEIAVDLMNTEKGPVLDGYLMRGNQCLASAPPGRELASPLKLSYGNAQYELVLKPV